MEPWPIGAWEHLDVSFESTDFREMLPHTVSVSTVATLGVGGAASFSTSVTSYRARVTNINRQVFDSQGQVQMAAYEAWVASTGVLAVTSKYTLPDGATPPVLRVEVFPDDDGYHNTHILFGRHGGVR